MVSYRGFGYGEQGESVCGPAGENNGTFGWVQRWKKSSIYRVNGDRSQQAPHACEGGRATHPTHGGTYWLMRDETLHPSSFSRLL